MKVVNFLGMHLHWNKFYNHVFNILFMNLGSTIFFPDNLFSLWHFNSNQLGIFLLYGII